MGGRTLLLGALGVAFLASCGGGGGSSPQSTLNYYTLSGKVDTGLGAFATTNQTLYVRATTVVANRSVTVVATVNGNQYSLKVPAGNYSLTLATQNASVNGSGVAPVTPPGKAIQVNSNTTVNISLRGNGNGVLDPNDNVTYSLDDPRKEINDNEFADKNGDGIPDRCLEDKNGNGKPDDMEISRRYGKPVGMVDANKDGIPDVAEDRNGNGKPDAVDWGGEQNLDNCDMEQGQGGNCPMMSGNYSGGGNMNM